MQNNYIYEYYQAIEDGSIIVGRWIKLAYQMIISGLEKKRFFYSHKKALAAINFIENFVHHHEGALAPQLVKLELWQKALLSAIFGIVDSKGFRQYREVIIIMARKMGKTLLAAGIAEYMTYLDDYGARVYFTATKLKQAQICFDAYYKSITMEPELNKITKKRRTDIYVDENNATGEPIAFSAKKADGLNISCAICDEIASWSGDNGLKFYEVIKSSQGARKQPLIVSISTAGYVNDGIYDELIRRGTKVLLDDSGENRLLPLLYMIDDVDKWNDLNELQKAMPNLGVSVSIDYMLEEIAIAEGSLSKKAEFLTKYCNIKQNSSMAWISTKYLPKICHDYSITPENIAHTYVTGGIDLSQRVDLTSACVLCEQNNVIKVLSHFWMPEERLEEATARDEIPYWKYVKRGELSLCEGNYVNPRDVFEWFINLKNNHEILPLQTGYDRYTAQELVQDMQRAGYHMDDVYQGYNLTGTIMTLEALIKDGAIDFGDNELLKIHLLDVAIKVDNESRRQKIIKMNAKSHIDGIAAILDALVVRDKWHNEIGDRLKNIG